MLLLQYEVTTRERKAKGQLTRPTSHEGRPRDPTGAAGRYVHSRGLQQGIRGRQGSYANNSTQVNDLYAMTYEYSLESSHHQL